MNKKIKLGVVSSFDELCGNATFSEELAKGFSSSYDVSKIHVPIDFQENYDELSLNAIRNKLVECDAVNIQFELGLYGPTPKVAIRVIKKIMQASKNLSITMHRVDRPPKNITRYTYNHIKNFGFKGLLGVLIEYWKQVKLSNAYKEVLIEAKKTNSSIICHTYRELGRIKKLAPNVEVYVHPIMWADRDDINKVNLNDFFKNSAIPVLGLFGFISEYKNYDLVADAFKNENVNILIAGGSHPMSSGYGKSTRNYKNNNISTSSYIRKISTLFSDDQYAGRVFNITAPNDEYLIQLMKSVDVVCIPYRETGQSGSGIASMAIQYGSQVIFSDNKCTTELTRFLNRAPIKFDVDSPLSLVGAFNQTKTNKKNELSFSGFSFESQLNTYYKAMNL